MLFNSLVFSIFLCILLLFYRFVTERNLIAYLEGKDRHSLNIILPLGISFYIFQTLSNTLIFAKKKL